MAVMTTSEEEGTALLDVLAGLKSPILGSIVLNGQTVRAHGLKSRVAYVQSDLNLCKDLTVVQTLRFHYDLKKPTDKLGYLKIEAMDRVSYSIILKIIEYINVFSDKRPHRRPRFGTGKGHQSIIDDGIREKKTECSLSPHPRHRHRSVRSAHKRYGYLRHLLSRRIFKTMGQWWRW